MSIAAKTVTLLAVIAAVLGGIILIISVIGPKKKEYVHLLNPHIVQKEDMNALMVDFDGDPEVVIKEAFGAVFKTYYGMKGVPKYSKQKPPIARYEGFDTLLRNITENLKASDWRGFVAVPLPEGISTLPAKSRGSSVRIETVNYGTVAEIVHFGSYESEGPTIDRLKEYIENQGYEISGFHEEEYIKGPGVPFRSPKSYITIIRYQIRRK